MRELSRRNIACCNVRELLVNFLIKMEVTSFNHILTEEDLIDIFEHVSEEFDSPAVNKLLDAIRVYNYEVRKEP